MEETREGLAKYRSFGEMLANDPKFSDRKRNRDKDYLHTAKRSDLEDEVRKIFQAQRCFGNEIRRSVRSMEPGLFNSRRAASEPVLLKGDPPPGVNEHT